MLLASFLGFLLLFLLIGFSSVLVRSKEQSDYLLAGSSVPPSLIGLSAVATNNSGFMFIGVIGYTYATGLPAFTMMVGWILGDWMAATLVTRKVREVSEEPESPSGALSEIGREGDVLEIALMHAGSFFGEKALLEKSTRNASVAATTECAIYVLSRSDYERIASLNSSMRDESRLRRARPLGASKFAALATLK